ncbi:spore protease YyaC [Clostridium rectalis]|uniref:spore protease YyaC n=1 Tax=Clostridium rectalis TaxID=2040295 RepID=UPI000F62C343|nr:spore protease YyaC [Clostridium rectalis]
MESYNYFYALEDNSVENLSKYLLDKIKGKNKILILCIGADNCTGDSLGPLTGTLLKKSNCPCTIIGDLENIVAYNNLKATYSHINKNLKEYFIIAIDACLGETKDIGKIFVENEGITAASALTSNQICIGDISIKAVVNKLSSFKCSNLYILQQTRLFYVYTMADTISKALLKALKQNRNNYIKCTSKIC